MPRGERKLAALITAAGRGSRMGMEAKKEYRPLGGRPLIQHTLKAFLKTNSFSHLCLTVPVGGEEEARCALGNLLEVLRSSAAPELILVPGGATRQQSVRQGLEALAKAAPETVLIHDGARPWISPELIGQVIKAADFHGAAAPAIAAVDTMKRIDERGIITEHLARREIVGIQTPQGFRFSAILEAHRKAAEDYWEYTDDTEIFHRYKGPVFILPGDPKNRKVTVKKDLEGLE